MPCSASCRPRSWWCPTRSSGASDAELQLADGGEAPAVVGGGAETGEGVEVGGGAVAGVGVPAVAGMPAVQPGHQLVADDLGDDAGGGDGVAAGVTVDEGVVLEAQFGKRQAVEEEVKSRVASRESRAAHEPVYCAPHREGRRHPDVEPVDLGAGGGGDGDGGGTGADLGGQGGSAARRQDLRIA